MSPVISVSNLSKTYASGLQALKHIQLDIRRGEIFALLGPNGAGKTTLISIICGIINRSEGTVLVGGHDIVTEYRAARSLIGLVPQGQQGHDAFRRHEAAPAHRQGAVTRATDPVPGRADRGCRRRTQACDV